MNKTIEDALAYADTFDKPANKHMSIVMLATEVRRQRAEISAIIARAESAESELKKAREQEPVLYKAAFSNGDGTYSYDYVTWSLRKHQKPVHPVEHFYYTAPKPAAPAVPEEWIKVLGRLLDVFERCEAGFTPHLEIRYAVRDEARALLQTTGAKP